METIVKHSESKTAWNVIGAVPGKKYKICRVPYLVTGNELVDARRKLEAFELATYISKSLLTYGGEK